MLLKISDGVSGWTIFDQVDSVHLSSVRHGVKSKEELEDIEVLDDSQKVILLASECFPLKNEHSLDIGILEFERGGTKFAALYTNVAYICDNNGTTVEKVSVFNKSRRN